jgi:DNA-nicking Smr family endonuclease
MARRRKTRQANKYAHLHEPQAELDFHDRGSLRDNEIHRETLAFIEASIKAKHARVRIIVGKGLHSRGTPRAGPQVRRTLRRLEADGKIDGFEDERIDRGGPGAIVVRLAGPQHG